MAVHGFSFGFQSNILLIATTIICVAGLCLLFSRWGHGKPERFFQSWIQEAFRDGSVVFLRTLVFDVLLLRRTWKRSTTRWLVHMIIFWGFIFFGGFTLLFIFGFFLFYLDPSGIGGVIFHYLQNLTLSYSLLEYFILAACGYILVRRILVQKVRTRTGFSDLYLVGSVSIIVITGTLAEWESGYDILFGPILKNWSLAIAFLSLHIYATFLLFVMTIPYSRFRHIIATPLVLLARRGED